MIACEYSFEELTATGGARSYFWRLLTATHQQLTARALQDGVSLNELMRDLIARDLVGTPDLADRRILDHCPPSVPLPISQSLYVRLNPACRETLDIRRAALGVSMNCLMEGYGQRLLSQDGRMADYLAGLADAARPGYHSP